MKEKKRKKEEIKEEKKPEYKVPSVRTYTGDELLKELGPAQALYSSLPFG